MSYPTDVSRRHFLTYSTLGLLTAVGLPTRTWSGQILPTNQANPNFKPDVEIDLYAQEGTVSILPGAVTRMMQYSAILKTGPHNTLVHLPNSYLGPIIQLQKGQKVRIYFKNKLSEPSIVHWHGLHVPADMDGHPMRAINQGEVYVYEFEVLNRAGFHIYHPHPHEYLGRELYFGLAGGLLVSDQEEKKLGLPSGEYEIPIVIQDRRFDAHNQLVYGTTPHDRMLGTHGDHILINGRPHYELEVASRAYRLRIMNGSNARIYKLAWNDGTPMTVLGVDGGLLEKPETRPYLMLAPGERLDVWADFTGRTKGTELVMRSLSFRGALPKMAEEQMGRGERHGMGRRGMMMGGMGMMMGGGMALPIGSDYPLFTIRVTRETRDSPNLPAYLSRFRRYTINEAANRDNPIPIGISEGFMTMQLNGRPYAYHDVQPYERVPVNTIQVLDIFHAHNMGGGHGVNAGNTGMGSSMSSGMGMMGGMSGGGMMFSMAHPIHLHGQQFEIISRTVDSGETDGYATVKEGLVDSGLKDTVLIMPGEKVRILKPFDDFKGLFMYHCHNIEHEDMGMMREFMVM